MYVGGLLLRTGGASISFTFLVFNRNPANCRTIIIISIFPVVLMETVMMMMLAMIFVMSIIMRSVLWVERKKGSLESRAE